MHNIYTPNRWKQTASFEPQFEHKPYVTIPYKPPVNSSSWEEKKKTREHFNQLSLWATISVLTLCMLLFLFSRNWRWNMKGCGFVAGAERIYGHIRNVFFVFFVNQNWSGPTFPSSAVSSRALSSFLHHSHLKKKTQQKPNMIRASETAYTWRPFFCLLVSFAHRCSEILFVCCSS